MKANEVAARTSIMSQMRPVRGTQDLLPEAMHRHRHISDTARRIAELYGFAEIATPIFEFTEVFARPIGETTDIVTKEMYSLKDRGGEDLSLRPENTAGVVRALLSNGLTQNTPLKFFYSGPMFRYERPQRGRFRQFHQIGIELLGVPQPQADIEVIALGQRILEELGVAQHAELQVNTLGDPQSRAAYREALVSYFSAHQSRLSEDSRRRLERNPLRILDSKDPGDVRLNADAPPFEPYLNAGSQEFFTRVLNGLDRLGIAYRLNCRLVRGLDYYTHTVFEFVTTHLGAQSTMMAGGRYDGLVELMGGPAMAGVGWAAGIERLAALIAEPPLSPRPIALIPMGSEAEAEALNLAEALRGEGFVVELGYSGNVQRRLGRANRLRARAAVIIGDDEIRLQKVSLLDLDNRKQELVWREQLIEQLKTLTAPRAD
jgi:histidyl-tRNA synthetase